MANTIQSTAYNIKHSLYLFLLIIVILLSGAKKANAQFCLAASPYSVLDPCYLIVIANDPFCCTTFWDGICQNAYDACTPPGPSQAIVVSNNTYTPQQLVTDVLLGACVEASNITYVGAAGARGSFTNGNALGFPSGILLSSGNVMDAPGPDNGISSTGHGTPGDTQLQAIAGVLTFDAAIIEFDFIATTNQINFEYVFASDEYQGYTCGTVNDAFGFFITGPGYAPGTNVALVPGTSIPVSINTVNQGFPSGGNSAQNCLDMDPNYVANSVYFNNNVNGPEISYNGYTDVFVAELNLIPCETYHIKLAIADGGDSGFDSAVFLKQGSFSAGIEVDVIAGTFDQTLDAIEGCQNGYFMFVNQGAPLTEPTDFSFTIGGTATMGTDYTNIPSTITFLPGQDTVYVTIQALLDGISEGIETIELTLPEQCSCNPPTVISLNILDNDALTATISNNVTICAGGSATLQLTGGGSLAAPYSFSWNTGSTNSQIIVSPAQTTTYIGTVTDQCGTQEVELQVTVTVANQIVVNIDDEICSGGQYTLPNGSTTGNAGLYTFNFVTAQNCDSIVNVNLSVVNGYNQTVNASLCQGNNYVLPNGNTVSAAGSYPVLLTATNGCDSLVTTVITISPNTTGSQFVSICTGESYVLPNGVSIELAGNYNVTLTSASGCDSVVTYTLETTPVYGIALAETICNGEAFTLPDGTTTTAAGNYIFNFTSINGCDSIVNLTLGVGNLQIVTQDVSICQGQSYLLPNGTTVNTAGYYEITTAGGDCGIQYQITVTVNPSYSSTLTAQICQGSNYVLPNGTSANTSGTYVSNLSTVAGCDSVIQVQLTVVPVVNTNTQVHLCAGESYTLPDGSEAAATGNYSFTYTSAAGCDSIVNVSVTVHPTYNIELNTIACDNQTIIDPNGNPINQSGFYVLEYSSVWGCDSIVNLTITVYPTYSFTTDVSICSGEQFVTEAGQIVFQSGTYYDFLLTQNWCDSTLVYNVTVVPSPVAMVNVSPNFASIYNPVATFTNVSFGADSVEWNFFELGTFSDSVLTFNFTDVSGFYPYCLTVWNADGCAHQICNEFEVREEFVVFVPNAFSPNGDGVNDFFTIEGMDIDPDDYHLQIFNRWGELIFESRSPSVKWNGTHLNSSSYFAQEEVYVYRAMVGSLATREKRELSGSVTVVR
jgi:gliding motility-associated-like protein